MRSFSSCWRNPNSKISSVRILIVTQYFWPENFRINDLAVGMTERGHHVTVLTGIPNYPNGRFFDGYGYLKKRRECFAGVNVIRMPIFARGSANGVRLILNYLSFAISSCVAALFLRGRHDVIFVFQPSPITVGLPARVIKARTGAPILFWILDLWPQSLTAVGAVKSQALLRLIAALVRFIYKGCDRVLVQSRSFIPEVVKQGAVPEKVRYFPSWAEEVYRPQAAVAKEGLPPLPNGFRVMFAGNIGVAQDFETLLAVAERLRTRPDIHWVILGEGRMSGWVHEEVAKHGLSRQVHLLGQHPVEKMPAFFAAADVMLVSLKRAPNFALTIPGKVQSYLACGRPIVAMLDGEGARVIEESGAGLVCPAEDADGLADTILTMADMPKDQREEMGRKGRRYFEANFARSMLFDRLETWMAETIEEKAR